MVVILTDCKWFWLVIEGGDALIILIFCVYSGLQTIMFISFGPYLTIA
jgi:hypothetical protein